MKRWFCIVFVLVLAVGLLAGCGGMNDPAEPAETAAQEPLQIVTTIFPVYDWVREVMGETADGAELTLLLDSGVDLHSYQPTAEDMVKISACDLFIYVGGESDEWVDGALAEAVNPDMVVIDLMDVLGDAVKEEEVVEGMQDEEHDHHHDEGEDHEETHEHEEEGPEYDEHVWLSLRNAAVLCDAIAGALGELDPENSTVYTANAAAYAQKLNALDADYQAVVESTPLQTILFGDRFPFRYLADDYGLTYYAAFVGCSAETEASFETIVFLAGKVDELGLPAVLTIESGDGKIARTIVENTAAGTAQILQMDSLQSTTARDVAEGATYLGAMERNLDVLRQALGAA